MVLFKHEFQVSCRTENLCGVFFGLLTSKYQRCHFPGGRFCRNAMVAGCNTVVHLGSPIMTGVDLWIVNDMLSDIQQRIEAMDIF